MKKLYLFFALMISVSFTQSQSARLVLVEEFTAEDCGPCAAINPSFNQLIRDNSSKAVAIKYQGRVGSGTNNVLYNQNKSDVDSRENYYSVTSAPYAVMDGNYKKGNAGQIKATDINARHNMASPFNLSVSHQFTPNADSVSITIDIECTESFTVASGNLKLRMALVERRIELSKAAPNGEKVFEGVMRKMYPSPSGTTITHLWTDGDLQTLQFKYAIPAYIYDKSELQLVAFIQNDATKEVIQAAISSTQLLPLDAKMNAYNSTFMQCGADFEPKVTIKNNGTTTLTSLDLIVKINNAVEYTYNWSGSLASGATEEVTLPYILQTTPGAKKIQVIAASPNGTADQNNANDSITADFAFKIPAQNAPVLETFESNIPANFLIHNPGGNLTWQSANYSAFGQGSKSVLLRFYAIGVGDEDYLYLPTLDLTNATYARVAFDFAHARYGNDYFDQCDVEGSIDCGKTWITLWSKKGPSLATVSGNITANFLPTDTSWKSDFASLDLFGGRTDILVRFKGVSDYGNNLYVDNINVEITSSANGGPTLPSAVADVDAKISMKVYPNPANDFVQIELNEIYHNGLLSVVDARGVVCATKDLSNSSDVRFSTDKLSNGFYFLVVEADGKTGRKAFVVTR